MTRSEEQICSCPACSGDEETIKRHQRLRAMLRELTIYRVTHKSGSVPPRMACVYGDQDLDEERPV